MLADPVSGGVSCCAVADRGMAIERMAKRVTKDVAQEREGRGLFMVALRSVAMG